MLVENISVGEKKKRKERQYRSSQEFSYVLLFSYIYGQASFYCLLFSYEIYA